nr:hypothetical protein [Tanacetum cinerariifolium]
MLVAQEVGEDADKVHSEDVNVAGIVAEDEDVVLEDTKDVAVENDTIIAASTTITAVDFPILAATIIAAPTLIKKL